MGMGELQLDIYAQVKFYLDNNKNNDFLVAYSKRIWSENSNG
jgi:hypothetical protein